MAAKVKLYCGTANPGKLAEYRQAAGGSFEVLPFGPLACPETGDTFEANAREKALCYGRALGEQVGPEARLFADDSGLEVDGLRGAPGVFSARFAGPDAAPAANNRLLVEKLRSIPADERTARFVCVVALVRGGRVEAEFRSEVEGRMELEARGGEGFGYDPFFYFPPTQCTFAELDAETKWRHSHRGKAFRKLLEWLGEAQR